MKLLYRKINKHISNTNIDLNRKLRCNNFIYKKRMNTILHSSYRTLPILICNMGVDMYENHENISNYNYGKFLNEEVSMIIITYLFNMIYKIQDDNKSP